MGNVQEGRGQTPDDAGVPDAHRGGRRRREHHATGGAAPVRTSEFQQRIAAAKRGEPAAIGELWSDLHPRLVRFLWTLAGDSAEDLASDTWLLVARGLHRFEGDADHFRAWVFTIARHRWVDWRRSLARRPAEVVAPTALRELAAADDPAAEVEAAASLKDAVQMVRRLPADQAEVILLRVVAGLGLEEVARVVRKRPGTVRVLQHRGLKRLSQQLNGGSLRRLGKL